MSLILGLTEILPTFIPVFYNQILGKSLHNVVPIYLSTFILFITCIFQPKRTAQ